MIKTQIPFAKITLLNLKPSDDFVAAHFLLLTFAPWIIIFFTSIYNIWGKKTSNQDHVDLI